MGGRGEHLSQKRAGGALGHKSTFERSDIYYNPVSINLLTGPQKPAAHRDSFTFPRAQKLENTVLKTKTLLAATTQTLQKTAVRTAEACGKEGPLYLLLPAVLVLNCSSSFRVVRPCSSAFPQRARRAAILQQNRGGAAVQVCLNDGQRLLQGAVLRGPELQQGQNKRVWFLSAGQEVLIQSVAVPAGTGAPPVAGGRRPAAGGRRRGDTAACRPPGCGL